MGIRLVAIDWVDLPHATAGRSARSANRIPISGGKGTMKKTALILFAHGSRTAQWADPFYRLQQHIERNRPDILALPAFLEAMQPTLQGAMAQIHAAGLREVVVLPVFLAAGAHLKRDLPLLVAQATRQYPDMRVRVLPPIGDNDALLQAIANWASAAID